MTTPDAPAGDVIADGEQTEFASTYQQPELSITAHYEREDGSTLPAKVEFEVLRLADIDPKLVLTFLASIGIKDGAR